MEHLYKISGMTCNGCVASVRTKLSQVPGVKEVDVDLSRQEAKVTMDRHLSLEALKVALPDKYAISEKKGPIKNRTTPHSEGDEHRLAEEVHEGRQFTGEPSTKLESSGDREPEKQETPSEEPSKWSLLKPLLLIFAYLFTASYLLNFREWNTAQAMLDFMGLFYIVFSFFKLLDLKGFPDSFRMYDPLARAVPAYGWVYPFLELTLGLFCLFRFQVTAALWITILILGITTFGVAKTLLDKKSIRCACLGTALKLPMTEATLIENTIMLGMAFWMLFVL